MPKQKKTKKPAFTLVELVIVMVITMFLITMVLQSAFGSTAQLKFINSSNKVVDLIRQARSLAISGKAQPDYTDFNNDNNKNDLVTPAGYGVYFVHYDDNSDNTDKIVLFVDNHSKAPSGAEGAYNNNGMPDFGNDVILEVFSLPKGIQFMKDAATTDNFGLPGNNGATVTYTPIFADVIFLYLLGTTKQG